MNSAKLLVMAIPDSRRCTKCGEIKPLDEFSKAPKGKYGRKASCKECDAARVKAAYVPRPHQRRRGPFTGDEMKTCRRCGESKPLREFSLSRKETETQNAVYRSDCKVCCSERAMQWFRDNPERQYDSRRAHSLRAFYGITVAEYDALLARQGGGCAICGNDEPAEHGRTGKKFKLSVDHDHATGRVRGLLCQRCNRAIGLLGDDPVLLQRAIGYLAQAVTHEPPLTA